MSPRAGATMIVVAKIGTSSITDAEGQVSTDAVAKLCGEVARLRDDGHQVVIVTSGAIAAGLPALGLGGRHRPRDAVTLQAVSAVGQSRLMQVYDDALGAHGLVAGQVLLAPLDFMQRRQYLHARGTVRRLLELGVVPVVNENDAVADDEIRFGDNDRLAALVAHLVGAELLVLLTDTPGLLTADPRLDVRRRSSRRSWRSTTPSNRWPAGRGAPGAAGAWPPRSPRPRSPPGRGCARSSPPPSATTCWPTPWPGPPVWAPWCCPTTATCPPASCGSPSPWARPARSWSTTVPAGRCSNAGRVAAARRRHRGARSLRGRRRRGDRRPRRRGVRQGPGASRRPEPPRRWPDGAAATSPTAPPVRGAPRRPRRPPLDPPTPF